MSQPKNPLKRERYRRRVALKAAKARAHKKRHPGRSNRRSTAFVAPTPMTEALQRKQTQIRRDSAPQSLFRRTISGVKKLFRPQKRV